MLRNRVYYGIKPLMPSPLRLMVRRWFARRQRARVRNIWPIAPGSEQRPPNWPGWPNGKKFALVLTHDVESEIGLTKCRQLMKLEKDLGFRSSFNFIPEGSYEVPERVREELVRNGFEVGVHDLRHDGKLYSSRRDFAKNAVRINDYLREWNAVGFRSGFMLHNLGWLHDLNIAYDASTFDTDPFEPQPDHRNTIFPFWVSLPNHAPRTTHHATQNGEPETRNQEPETCERGYIELPYTLPQDSTLFVLFRERTPHIWLQKLNWIAQHGGMALLDTHPDYMSFQGRCSSWEYPAALYREFLEYVKMRYRDDVWHATAREVAEYVRDHLPRSGRNHSSVRVNGHGVAPKVWVDLDNTPHVPFFEPIIRELRARGYEVVCTARDAFQVCELARQRGLSFREIGRHSGKNRFRKAFGLFYRALQLLPVALREKPALALSHGSRSQIIAARLLNIPTVLIEDYEHCAYPPLMSPRWEIVPETISDSGLCCAPERARRYPGLKEHVYVPNFRPDTSVLNYLGLRDEHLIVTVRPPATEAHYHNADGEKLFFELMDFLLRDSRVRVVLLPRNGRQADWIKNTNPRWLASQRVVVPRAPLDGLNVIFHSDLVVSGGGTMNREAAALGVPAYSILRGKIGAVDRGLEKAGQLTLLRSASEFAEKIKLDRRPRPRKIPDATPRALDSILAHIEEIFALECSGTPLRAAAPARVPVLKRAELV